MYLLNYHAFDITAILSPRGPRLIYRAFLVQHLLSVLARTATSHGGGSAEVRLVFISGLFSGGPNQMIVLAALGNKTPVFL